MKFLKSLSVVPPGGWQYRQPETGWSVGPVYFPYAEVIRQVQSHRFANAAKGLDSSYDAVERDVEAYMVASLEASGNGNEEWIVDSESPPKRIPLASPPRSRGDVQSVAKRLKADIRGAAILSDWLGSGGITVPQTTADSRSSVCGRCKFNTKVQKIEGAIAEAILRLTRYVKDAELHVDGEGSLGSCKVCGCHLPLKVWVPLDKIKQDDDASTFPKWCWINTERPDVPKVLQNMEDLKVFAYASHHAPEPQSCIEQTGWDGGIFKLPISTGEICFNPTLWMRSDGLWLTSRLTTNQRNRVVFFKIEQDMSVSRRVEMDNDFLRENEHVEDPRVVPIPWAKDHALIGVTNFFYVSGERGSYAHISALLVNPRFAVQSKLGVAIGGNGHDIHQNTAHEKNWLWFYHNQGLHVIHNMQDVGGSRVFLVNDSGNATAQWSGNGVPKWPFGQIRGGTNPVLVNGEYWTFYHSSIPWQGNRRRYFVGACAFEAKPPFSVTRNTITPFMAGSSLDPMLPWSPLVVFPCGAIVDADGTWTVTYGINDAACGWFRVKHSELAAITTPV